MYAKPNRKEVNRGTESSFKSSETVEIPGEMKKNQKQTKMREGESERRRR